MTQFDYKRAWEELVNPAFKALPQDMRDLFSDAHVFAAGLHQNKDLTMPWPEDKPEFRNRFFNAPSEILAQAARVIYYWGHLGSPSCYAGGTYWKFSHYADQILREKCKLSSHSGNGIFYEIHQGLLRVCCSTPNSWFWEEIGVGTLETLERLERKPAPAMPQSPARSGRWLEYELAAATYISRLVAENYDRQVKTIQDFLKMEKVYTG